MDRILVLGTGNAAVTECYNTCFILETDSERLLVDCGGGNGILRQLKAFGIKAEEISKLYISHEHCDHLTGIVWIVRMVAQSIIREGSDRRLDIWCQDILEDKILAVCGAMLPEKQMKLFGDRIVIHTVNDGGKENICGRDFTFFDIQSTKAPQFGFSVGLDCGKLVFAGDEPISVNGESYAKDACWLLSEAFCTYGDREVFKPYKKNHATAADEAKLAERLGVKNLVLWHTEDKTLSRRRELYTAEAKLYFSGDVYVPDDLDTIELK